MQNQPSWIKEDLDQDDINSICRGGCESGAYMPAVTYWQAIETMGEHGDDVMQYIDDQLGLEAIDAPKETTWGQLACYYLSVAVELWAMSHEEGEWTTNQKSLAHLHQSVAT